VPRSFNEFGQWAVIGNALLVVMTGSPTLYSTTPPLPDSLRARCPAREVSRERRAADSRSCRCRRMSGPAISPAALHTIHTTSGHLSLAGMARRRFRHRASGSRCFIDERRRRLQRAAPLPRALLSFSRRPARTASARSQQPGRRHVEMLLRTIGRNDPIETVLRRRLCGALFRRPPPVPRHAFNLVSTAARDAMAGCGKSPSIGQRDLYDSLRPPPPGGDLPCR